jgi:hypothetical protein
MIHAVDVAESQVGITERTGANDGIPATRYMRGDELAWCAGFVLYCNECSDDPRIAVDDKTYYRLRSVKAFREWAQEQPGCWIPRGTAQPQRNDLIVWDGHIGIVTKLEAGRVHTVEGNSGDKVARRSYLTSDRKILGYIRWASPT